MQTTDNEKDLSNNIVNTEEFAPEDMPRANINEHVDRMHSEPGRVITMRNPKKDEEVSEDNDNGQSKRRLEKMAGKVMDYVKDQLVIAMPYFNRAILKMPVQFYIPKDMVEDEYGGFATDTRQLYINPQQVLDDFKEDRVIPARRLLHAIFHCLYKHHYNYNKMDTELWDFACDVAVETAIIDLDIPSLREPLDNERRVVWKMIAKRVEKPYAEKIYEFMLASKDVAQDWLEYASIFKKDHHYIWKNSGLIKQDGEFITSESTTDLDQWGNEWDRVFANVKKDKETFENGQGISMSSVTDVIGRIEGDDNDYTDFLYQFAKLQEEVHVNDDEFDYIYYTYGMQLYKNMPLIEPLEYRERLKIYDFVIAIDTSGSCRGSTVKNFLRRTYSILKSTEIFGTRINVHIIQCDNMIQKDDLITSDEQFEMYVSNVTVIGSGGTDFRPVFNYVKELKDRGEFTDLRGMLYLTDGLGIYPESEPDFKSAFIIMPLENEIPPLPSWAISRIVSREDLDR